MPKSIKYKSPNGIPVLSMDKYFVEARTVAVNYPLCEWFKGFKVTEAPKTPSKSNSEALSGSR